MAAALATGAWSLSTWRVGGRCGGAAGQNRSRRRSGCFAADLTDPVAARELPRQVAAELGRLDLLVNSAAVMHRLRFEDTTPEQYDAILGLNLRSVFFCTQGAAAALRATRGKVINMADLAGLEPWPGFAAHSVSKAGVVMLTKVLARALAPEVTVNAIAPGAVLVPEEYTPPSATAWPAPRLSAGWGLRPTRWPPCSTSSRAVTS
jgi:NAD(P)-dependent dehydrogenase (short-subunit alcohol dehydrogenase family)